MEFYFNIWVIYFYFYCVAGWIFESGNVSIRDRRWTNRGFMKGPWLPLYGSGAIIILLATLPFGKHPVAVFFVGAIAATILEYVTGVVMLAIFKVRYWDYRYRKIQFQGHICLVSTIAWGCLSLLMVYVIHPYVERFLLWLHPEVVNVATFLITLCISFDFANSLREALDLRKLIIQAAELKKKLAESMGEQKERIAERAKSAYDKFEQKLEDGKEQLGQKIEESKEQLGHKLEESKEQLEQRFEERRDRYIQRKAERKEAVFEWKMEETAEIQAALERLRQNLEVRAKGTLRRNPTASMCGLEEETEQLRKKL